MFCNDCENSWHKVTSRNRIVICWNQSLRASFSAVYSMNSLNSPRFLYEIDDTIKAITRRAFSTHPMKMLRRSVVTVTVRIGDTIEPITARESSARPMKMLGQYLNLTNVCSRNVLYIRRKRISFLTLKRSELFKKCAETQACANVLSSVQLLCGTQYSWHFS